MSRYKKKSGVPDRWLDYTAVGKRLHGTRFIAFKVPLKQSYSQQISPSDIFGPWELLDTMKKENQELGLIIDLTFTTRYYSLQDLPESLLLMKIMTKGHEVPSNDTILSFKRAVHRFLRDNGDNDKLIGVHCTHGLNRTGYLICRYLIDVNGMDPREAVQLFNSSRGHSIERQNYLEDLRSGPKRSNMGMEACEQEPQRGCAVRQPLHSDSRDQSRPHFHARSHRYVPPHSHPCSSHDALLPSPPCVWPPVGGPSHLYQRFPPHPENQWSRAPKSAKSWSRYPPPPQPEWRPASHPHQDRGEGLLPPPLPRYRPHWGKQSSYDGPDERRAGPYRHRNQDDRYDQF